MTALSPKWKGPRQACFFRGEPNPFHCEDLLRLFITRRHYERVRKREESETWDSQTLKNAQKKPVSFLLPLPPSLSFSVFLFRSPFDELFPNLRNKPAAAKLALLSTAILFFQCFFFFEDTNFFLFFFSLCSITAVIVLVRRECGFACYFLFWQRYPYFWRATISINDDELWQETHISPLFSLSVFVVSNSGSVFSFKEKKEKNQISFSKSNFLVYSCVSFFSLSFPRSFVFHMYFLLIFQCRNLPCVTPFFLFFNLSNLSSSLLFPLLYPFFLMNRCSFQFILCTTKQKKKEKKRKKGKPVEDKKKKEKRFLHLQVVDSKFIPSVVFPDWTTWCWDRSGRKERTFSLSSRVSFLNCNCKCKQQFFHYSLASFFSLYISHGICFFFLSLLLISHFNILTFDKHIPFNWSCFFHHVGFFFSLSLSSASGRRRKRKKECNEWKEKKIIMLVSS